MTDTSSALIPHLLGQVRDSLSNVIKRASEMTSFTPEPDAPWRAEVLSRDEIGSLATDLARQHRGEIALLPGTRLLQRYQHNRATLGRVYKSLSDAAQRGEPLTAGAEWLLDNYHVVERHAVAIKKYLPPGYYRTLPRFKSGELRGFPRIYHLALEFIIHTDAVVEPQFATHFISSYQKELELGSGELWAFSIMLRFALLENLCRLTREAEKELFSRREAFEVVDAVLGNDTRTGTEIMVDLAARLNERASFFPYGALEMMKRLRARGRKAYLALQFLEEALKERGCEPEELLRAEDHNQAARQISVGNTLTSLTSIDQIDWRSWFEEVSLIHHIFEQDPANIYNRSDFETRDRLRHRVEHLARLSESPESLVAQKAIDLASASTASETDSPNAALVKRYVGSFLQSPGREALEGALGIHLPFTTWLRRWGGRNVVPVYLSSIALFTVFFLLYLAGLASFADERWWVVLLAVLLFILPASEFASNLVQYLATRTVPPRPLPKLDFEGRIPAELKTAITVHTIFSSTAGIERAIDALEVRYLGNDDAAFTYILLADLPDAKAETSSSDDTLIKAAVDGITRLNLRHGRVLDATEGNDPQESRSLHPFMLFFRRRLWNSGEGKWMGWERKRGKIEEFNRYLLGDRENTLTLHVGEPEQLAGIRYVITLDSDTQLSREVAKKLVATAAHPVNRPVFDEESGRVVSGYGLIQPRVTISLTSATASRFSELFSGHAGLDPYTNVVSDVYQDLFGEGSFFGKAIYDVEVFERALKNRVPENTLLSHDLFEGLFVRVGLASDIEVYDDFPSRYMAYAKRLHRWVRGDWQLLPWTFPKVPSKTGKIPNPLTTLGLWKVFDNLRRGLLPPACFLALLSGWAFLPGDAWGWTALILLVISFPVFTGLASVFALPTLGLSIGGLIEGVGKDLWRASARAACAVCFLPHQATLMVHAMCVTLHRIFISRKNLLEWEPAEQTEKRARTEQRAFLQLFLPSFSLALATILYVAFFRQEALPFATPFLLLWGASPLISKWLSKPIEQGAREVSPEDSAYLRKAAFETWMFFDDYLVDRYHYLMPDNLQLVPREVVAERTSPTNISLSMLSCISAYDLGFTPLHRALHRVGLTVATISKLEKYRGHLFNWYNISTLEPLNPRYISTVDSGNLLGHLYTLESVLTSCCSLPLVTNSHRETLQQLGAELLARSPKSEDPSWQAISSLQAALLSSDSGTLSWVCEVIKNRDLIAEVQDLSSRLTDENGTALHRYAKILSEISLLEELVPWAIQLKEFVTIADSPAFASSQTDAAPLKALVGEVRELLSKLNSETLSVRHLTHLSDNLSSMMFQMLSQVESQGGNNDPQLLLQVIVTSLQKGMAKLVEFEGGVAWISDQLKRLIAEMDFSFLYDDYRKLFTIGFNAEHARRDASFYDLLASEARLLSFLAVARGEVAQKHWFALGRALTNTSGGKALLSWSGTMFEYLMPFIVMRDYPSTLLGRSARAVVRAQMDYCRRQRVPWGISESAYSGVDFEKTYQYRAFGVPGLGLKRGLSFDLVVSPYSTFLALEFAPSVRAAIDNLKALEKKGARGRYGFYESVDFTTSRVARTQDHHTVASFFAHHQGMSLVSVDNFLNGNVMQDRLHAQPIVKSAELLLHERFPERIAAIVPHEPEVESVVRLSEEPSVSGLDITTSPHTLSPRVRVLSNGRYSVMVDSAGGGFSSYDRTQQLTRWKEDPTCTPFGSFVYISEPATSKLWSSAHQPTRVEADSYEAIFSPGRVEFKRFDNQLFTHTEITVAPEDDVELRRVTITNLGSSKRTIEVTSYLEPALATRRADASHPAFSKLFVRTEVLADSDALLCTRRPRSEHESSLYFFHRVTLRTSYAPVVFHTSRSDFIGRGHTLENPQALAVKRHNTTGPESHVDPILGLQVTIDLEPGTAETVVFVSGAARIREDALGLIERYQELMHISRAFELAWSRAQVELRNHAYSAGQADMFHRLAGCLFYSEPSVRASSQTIQANRLSQSGLWRFGISGDLPIVLAKINNPKQVKVLQELLLAHHFLRERGLELDLVILHHYPGGYMQQLAEELEYTVRSSPGGQLLDRPGGVFLRSTTQVSEAEGILLETVARVVVDAAVGGLAEVLKSAAFDQMVPVVPRSARQRPKFSWIRPSEPLRLANTLGGFSASGQQYVMPRIGTLRPPVPWSNVIANQDFGFLVTESGSGYTWSENSRENRLTSWSNDPVLDPASEAVFLRDADSGDYWSLTPAPAGDGLEYRVEHGFGYSEFSTAARSIESVLTLSGANTERVKWYGVTLTNHDSDERRVDLFFYVDLVLGISREESYRHIVTSFDRTTQTLCAVNHYNNEFAGRVVSVGSSEPITGYSASRLEFLGRNGELGRPLALERAAMHPFFMAKPRPAKLSGKTGAGFDPCGALHISVTLRPREQRELCFFLSESASFDEARRSSLRYRSLHNARHELTTTRTAWQDLVGAIQVETPSESTNLLLNGWLLYQTVACRLLGRSAFYQSGGALGFRDQLQDSLALLPTKPELVRDQIILHAQRQFREGDVQHWWHPPTGRGVRTRITDDLLWLPYAVARYIERTDDYSILDQEVPFLDGPVLQEDQMENYFVPTRSHETATILEHCLRTFKATERVGPHGLPLMGAGDWNDGMNEVGRHGKGESVWLAWFQIEVIKRFAPVLEKRGLAELAEPLRERSVSFAQAAEAHAWDGHWYRRAYYDDGTPIGSSESGECTIDSLSQSWAVISGAAPDERRNNAMHSVSKLLVDREGGLIKVLTPPFDKTPKNPGYIKGYPPGIRENGGQYTHAAAWVIIATAQMGLGSEAAKLFEMINPIEHTRNSAGIDCYKAEPYVVCGDVYSEGGLTGRAGWSWYTGSSGWLYQAGIESILGLRVSSDFFRLQPALPKEWEQAKISVRRGSKTFDIEIRNPEKVAGIVKRVSVNGKAVEDLTVRWEAPGYGEKIVVIAVIG